jgi:hypothetical protein
MKRSRPALAAAALVALVFLGAATIPDPQTFVKDGEAAAARGDYAAAAALYKRAEERTTEPGEVAYRLAVVKYQLGAGANSGKDLSEAEELFRCCLARNNRHRPAALFGLGNCLLLKAKGRDLDLVRSAIEAYEQSLREAGGSGEPNADDVRHNLERAKLLALQLLAPATRQDEPEPPKVPDDPRNPPKSKPDDPNPTGGNDPTGSGRPDPHGKPLSVKPDAGNKAIETPETMPGVGKLTPIPDLADHAPLPPAEALRHLESATKRVLEERQSYRLQKARPAAPGVRDW